jgi:hypothetical protein
MALKKALVKKLSNKFVVKVMIKNFVRILV